ncbi:glutamate receptor 2.2 [Rhynchospora pubera]|uniref:Glutamate receptor n=1 Tax=Rhynchospora pubera TaxID=906938 RepID=A0AAV8HS08_9POAL|nr:glutamate receptor 2.2 [Rhynchospora pubera]
MEKKNQLSINFSSSIFLSIFVISFLCSVISAQAANKKASTSVGVILDLTSESGKGCKTSISLAYEDFYAANPHYTTRVKFIFRDSTGNALKAANAATKLIKNGVQAIIGPLTFLETNIVASVCNQSQIPVISISTSSSAISASNLPILIRATLDFSSEIRFIADFIKNHSWHYVIPIYEDSDYGASILPSLIHNLYLVGAEVHESVAIPSNAPDSRIENELRIVKGLRGSVFIVHIMSPLAIRLFRVANKLGMVSNNYVWIVTSSIGGILDTLEPATLNIMNGIVGLRTHTQSDRVINFSAKYKARLQKDYNIKVKYPSMYQLWAYDVAWAIAIAVEKTKLVSSDASLVVSPQNSSIKSAGTLCVSENETNLVSAIHSTKFEGLVGNFSLVDGQRQFAQYDILNVLDNQTNSIGKGRDIPPKFNQNAPPDFTVELASTRPGMPYVNGPLKGREQPYGNRPGESYVKQPLTSCSRSFLRSTPTNCYKNPRNEELLNLKIGTLVKKGFNNFVNATLNEAALKDTNQAYKGFSIKVFDTAMDLMDVNFTYTFVPVDPDNATSELNNGNVDAIIGDMLIDPGSKEMANFTFTAPYLSGDIWVVVSKKLIPDRWTFLRPFPLKLWVVSVGFFFFTGITLWVIEHRSNPAFRGPVSEQTGRTFYFAFSTLVYAHDEKVTSNFSRFLLIIWFFTVFVLTQSYTASLTSILTVQQLQHPIANSIAELRKNGEYVGYQTGSDFVSNLLIEKLHFKPTKLRSYSIDNYEDALKNGSAHGGVGAIIDVEHYLYEILSRNCSEGYTKLGETFSTKGFGFVFNQKGYLVKVALSEAIMNMSIGWIEDKYFKDSRSCTHNDTQSGDTGYQILSIGSYSGLFIITGAVSSLMAIIFLINYVCKNKNQLKTICTENNSIIGRFRAFCKHFNKMDSNSSKKEVITTAMQEI